MTMRTLVDSTVAGRAAGAVDTTELTETFTIAEPVAQALHARGISAGLSPASTWLAVAAVLVHRYTGRDDVTIDASPVSGEVNASGNPTFEELLRRVRRLAGAASSGPVIRVVLQAPDGRGVLLRPTPGLAEADARCATIVLTLTASDGEVHGALQWSPDSVDRGCLVRLGQHVAHIAIEVGARPGVRLSQIQMLGADERTALLGALTGPVIEYPERTVHELFEQAAAATPDAVALVYGDTTMSFGELNLRANRLAHRLQAIGVGPEVPVGLCVRRCANLVVGVFAILKAGGAYVPLDPAYPSDRLLDMIEDANPPVIVTGRDEAASVPVHRGLMIDVETAAHDELSPGTNPFSRTGVDNTAYLVYTSGSTGRPKAIVLPHRCIANMLSRVPFVRDDPDEVSCLNTSIGVAFTTARLFLPLLCGLPLVIVPDGEERELTRLVRRWESSGVTNLAMVTPVLQQLLRMGSSYTSKLGRVRTMAVGGDLMTTSTLAQFAAAMPQTTLIHAYASTEIGGPATIHEGRVDPDAPRTSVGEPFPNTCVRVLDAWLNPVPIGVTGELCVSGRHLARGYLNQPALTAERWVPDPFRSDGLRLFRTGDVGCVLPNGELDILGRVDDQVKIRGFRIDVREVEAALGAHAAVAGAAVAVRDWNGGKRLVAFVLRAPQATPSATELRAHLLQRLPEPMLPSLIVFVDTLPRTPTGKVDRKALPLQSERPELDSNYEPPRSLMERQMAAVWTELLEVRPIGVHDHFVEVGGDSLFATRLAAKVQEDFGVAMEEALLFQRPTIALLSQYLEDVLAAGA